MASSLGSLVLQYDAAARITSEKSPRQPTQAVSHEVDHARGDPESDRSRRRGRRSL